MVVVCRYVELLGLCRERQRFLDRVSELVGLHTEVAQPLVEVPIGGFGGIAYFVLGPHSVKGFGVGEQEPLEHPILAVLCKLWEYARLYRANHAYERPKDASRSTMALAVDRYRAIRPH